jgi:hypothetical protein
MNVPLMLNPWGQPLLHLGTFRGSRSAAIAKPRAPSKLAPILRVAGPQSSTERGKVLTPLTRSSGATSAITDLT